MDRPGQLMLIANAKIGHLILLIPIERLQQKLKPTFLGLTLVLLQLAHAFGTLSQLKHIPNDYNKSSNIK